jgi:hypothetical protein
VGDVIVGGFGAEVEICVRDPALAAAIGEAVKAAIAAEDPPERLVVVVREEGDVAAVPGKLAVIGADQAALVDAVEAAGAAGIQLVWNGRPRRLERVVFAVLEAWRGQKRRCPLMLAADGVPSLALRRAIARQGGADRPSTGG